MNFKKRFPKTMRAKLEFQRCSKKYAGWEEKISPIAWRMNFLGLDILDF
jgi:hypothetical protein